MSRPLAGREPAPRPSLLDRPQRLGVLPTMWFWNDRERQRLILPLIAITIVPLASLIFSMAVRLHLSEWLAPGFVVLYPFLVMGLVERRIRAELRRRPLEERALAVQDPQSGLPPASGEQ